MVDLGKYAADILLSYGLTILLIAGLIGQSVWAARRARKALEERGE
ncbi:heme exporter protein CcmD [Jannaschia pohangensis]|uniref:Heme exporter protein D n=1 Tax=Jannaschia pohangensis TaxID=390807 RepID=A0A1I3SH11_9RHOB|nr:heme exporter protein CcmD [Jannaschia pohangensis]SFJ56716.1 heme exporter protein CcmD [Jannaschia pohangensis]